MMACHAQSMGLNDDQLLAVILLHDVCEDCGVAPDELPFSEEVREAVALLTKKFDRKVSKEENEIRYYDALKHNRLAAMAKVIDRCNNVSTMAGSFNDKKLAGYIDETETYVFPVLSAIKQTWPEYNNAVFLIKYQMLSVLETLKIMLSEK
jgi:GTP pyrophosphokinase